MSEPTEAKPEQDEKPGASSAPIATGAWSGTLLAAGAFLTGAGLTLAAIGPRQFGGVIVVVGWALLIYALHRLGRSGASL